MILAASAHLIVISARPFGEADRLIGKLVESLLHELGASQSVMNRFGITAAFSDRRNAGVRLDFNGGLPARPVGTEGRCQTWGADLAGAWKTVKYIVVGMLSKSVRDLFIELLYSSDQRAQLHRIDL